MRNHMETAAGRLGRVVAIRMAPGVDLLEGLQEAFFSPVVLCEIRYHLVGLGTK